MTRSASPESTGGVGPSYERAVAAVYLAALLTDAAGPGLTGTVHHVGAQQKSALDDLEIGFDASEGRTGVCRLQLKHELKLTDSVTNTDFAAIVADSWRELQNPRFQHGIDRVGGAAEKIAAESYYAAMKLNELARLAKDGDGFKASVAEHGGKASLIFNVVSTLSQRALERSPSFAELRDFWRHFHVVRVEAVMAHHDHRLRAIDGLRTLVTAADSPDPTTVFDALELVAGTLNIRAATLDRQQLVAELAERHGLRLHPIDRQLEPIARTAITTAAREALAWREHLGVRAVPPIFVPPDDGEAKSPVLATPFGLDGIEAALRQYRGLAILGSPGAGKTQSLVQIAEQLVKASRLIPIVHSLPKLFLRGGAILDGIAAQAPWREIGESGLAVLAHAGRLVLLLDGWNELSLAARDWAWEALDDLKRLHPNILFAITSRSGTVRPHGTAMQLDLAPLDRSRQFEAARSLDGEAGAQALTRARAKAGLRPLLATPLFLNAILAQAKAGTLPADRDSTIAALVERARGPDKLRETIRAGLQGQQDRLLEDIAWCLMEEQGVAITEPAILRIIDDSLRRLRDMRTMFSQITAPDALELLLADAILVATGERDARVITFAHHLLQEWFAAARLTEMISEGGAQCVAASVTARIDMPFWATAILLATERLGRRQVNPPLGKMVLASLGIAPFLAAEMVVRLPESIAASLDPALSEFVDAWSEEDPVRAVRFMLASGRSQFSARIWKALCGERQLLFQLGNRANLQLSALAGGWHSYFPTLTGQKRRTLLIDLVEQGDADALDLVTELALGDDDADLVASVIDYLNFHEERDHLNRVVANLDDEVGTRIARGSRPSCLSDDNARRWTAWRRTRADAATGAEWVQLALEFDTAPPDAIAEAALAVNFDNHWAAAQFYEAVAERHPQEFSAALAARVRRGDTIPHSTRQYLIASENADPTLIDKAAAPDTRWNGRDDIAQLLSPADISAMLAELLAPSEERYPRRDARLGAIADTLEHVSLPALVNAALAAAPANARDTAIVIDLLAGWQSGDDQQTTLPLAPDTRAMLESAIQEWAARLIVQRQGMRSDLAQAARLIGRIGREFLLPELLALWDADREQQGAQRRAVEEGRESASYSEWRISYAVHYRDALVRIGGAAVTAAMIEHFADPELEHDAAIVLGQIHVVDPKPRHNFGPGHNELFARRVALAERSRQPPEPTTAMILDRIDSLVAIGDADSICRALALAGPALHMHYGDRISSLRALFAFGHDRYGLRDFARAFGERGELIPSATVREAIVAEAAALKVRDWVPDNEYFRLNDWLRLVAFTDDPARALPDLATLPKHYDREHSLSDLAFGLGFSPSPGAVDALRMLQVAYPGLIFRSRWAASLHEIGGDAAANLLLDAIASLPDDPKQWNDTYGIHHALAALLKLPAPRARAFAMLERAGLRARQSLLVNALVEHMDEDDAMTLLDLADRSERQIIASVLIGRLENVAVSRAPIEGADNMSELDAAPLSKFRRLAFAALDGKAPRSHWAAQCLQALDHLRDRYGKPWAEPNHPAVDTGKPWPRAARKAWDRIKFGGAAG